MTKQIDKLQDLENKLIDFGRILNYETCICKAELEERRKLGLHGEEAIKHYNDWMVRYNLYHLVCKL